MFTELIVKDFRILKDQTFQLGKYITMLAGWNATGKSTVLALLANSSELKQDAGKTYNNKLFRADFSEILKGSIEYDESKSNRAELKWSNGKETMERTIRTTWQDKKKRFRVIPYEKDENGKKITDQKFPFPVLYLGLSRLYPLGETTDEQIKDEIQDFKNDQDRNWFIENHKKILSLSDNIKEITNINIASAKKNTSGITADNYDWKTNSSGQDNLSQILFAILSFKNLKREQSDDFKGGLLIIDEIEASLHPIAQERIINFLVKEAKSTGFQVVFTTHSLTIIKAFAQKTQSDDGNIVSHYFMKTNDQLEIRKNVKFEEMEDELLVLPYSKETPQKITVYTEDEEARWFLRKLLSGYLNRINILNISIGCSCLIDLMNVEPAFANHLVIFDGDLTDKNMKRIKKNNYLLLPAPNGKDSPEKVIHEFLMSYSNSANTYYDEQHKKIPKVKREYFRDKDVSDGNSKDRERYKEWFNQHKKLFDDSKIFDYWKKENEKLVDSFREDFRKIFDHIASKCNIPKIS